MLMKVMLFIVLLITMFSGQVFAANDFGRILEVYTTPDGLMAFRLDNGFPNANAANNCGTAGNVWAGVKSTDNPSIKASILTAKVNNSNVAVVTLGQCRGGWIKVEAMHFK